ncbi:hypothetical protein [Synechococcus sp. 1G10]|uniref:hypothetical protein n=1 Tax=Synechococcus sp. 1G10 TaxID=2025605 RepID=UPI00117D1791|nr:hypothetical protein [Synechococcus sp. 1G10]
MSDKKEKMFVALSAVMACFVPIFVTGCQEQSAEIILKSYGPENIKAGVPFNVQPDGESAMWADATGAPSSAVPVLAGVELPAVAVRDGGTLVTAIVPSKLTVKPGKYPLLLMDKTTGKKSNVIDFVVK